MPFCSSKCGYCAFYSNKPLNNKIIDNYLDNLELEVSKISSSISTLYIGGGTPTLLSIKQLERLFNCNGVRIREKVNELRSEGVPICGCQSGYYYSENVSDIKDTIIRLNSRIKKITIAENGLRRFLKDKENSDD